jgi:outer membrane protein OmpA-like peptidoglycan-associated protein
MKCLLILVLVVSTSAKALVTVENSDLWLYGSFDLGYSHVKTEVPNELDDKSGYLLGGAVFGSYNFEKNFIADVGLGWFYNKFESEVIDNRKVSLITKTFYLEINPRFRLNRRLSVGPVFDLILGEEFLAAPNPQLFDVDGDGTTDKLAGLNVMYEYPWKSNRGRLGAKLLKAIGINKRDAYVAMFSVQFGFPVWKESRSEPAPPQRVSPIEIEDFPEDSAVVAKIELNEQHLNFETNSAKLDKKSETFVKQLGEYLANNNWVWENLRIDGHTDIKGSNQYNLKLSNDRAKTVYQTLINAGVEAKRLRYVGYGEEKPLIKDVDSEEADKTNRRVELKFLDLVDEDSIQRQIDQIKIAVYGEIENPARINPNSKSETDADE